MRALILGAFLLVGCAPDNQITPCGVYLTGSSDLPGMVQHEARIIDAFPWSTCERLDGWMVQVVPEPFMARTKVKGKYTDVLAAGGTLCESRTMTVVLGNVSHPTWATSALAHEVAHAIDCPFANFDHTAWGDEHMQYAWIYLAESGAQSLHIDEALE